MREKRVRQNEEQINDSLEFCSDIKKYYEADELSQLNLKTLIKIEAAHHKKEQLKTQKSEPEPLKTQKERVSYEPAQSRFAHYIKVIIFIGVAVLFFKGVNDYLVQEAIVNGVSMKPTLENSDKLLLNKLSPKFNLLKRFDVVVFDCESGKTFIKRIMGLPGEKIEISNGKVYINGTVLKDDPIKEYINYSGIADSQIKLGDDEYFLLGDNRNESYDSRFIDVGLVKRKSIVGKVWLRVYPFTKFGVIK